MKDVVDAAVGGKCREAPHLGDILDARRWVLEAFSVLDNLDSRTECP